MKKNYVRLFMAFFCVIFYSCGVEEYFHSEDSKYKVINGIIHFKDHNAYQSVVNKLALLNADEKYFYSKKLGISSFYCKYIDIINKIDLANTTKSIKSQIKEEELKYVSLNSSVPSIRITNDIIGSIANEDGMFFVGKTLLRFVEDKEIIVKSGIISEAYNWEKDTNSNNIIIHNTKQLISKISGGKNARVTNQCASFYGSEGGGEFANTHIASTSASKISVPLGYQDQYNVQFQITSKGIFRRGWFGANSTNNYLTPAYDCSIYDWNNNFLKSKSTYLTTSNTGSEISYVEIIDAGQCYSFQIRYYNIYFSPTLVPPIQGGSCSVLNCTYEYTKYRNDRTTVYTSCN